MDPCLDSISNLLMEEGTATEDAACSQQDGDAAYQAIFCSLLDIIGEPPDLCKSSVDSSSSSQNSQALQFPLQLSVTQHSMCYNGINILTHQIPNSGASTLPPHGNLQRSFLQPDTADTSLVMPASSTSAVPNASSTSSNVQDYHGAIKFNDEKLMDIAQVSCWKKDKLPRNRNFGSCLSSRRMKEQDDARIRLPSPYKEFSLQLSSMELLFQDLKIGVHYKALYAGKPDISEGAPTYGNKKNVLAIADKGSKSGRKRTAYAQEYVDLKELLVSCAQAVAVGNAIVANEFLQDIRQRHGSSASGSALQRAVHYFSEALVARMKGTGGQHFRAILHQKPCSVSLMKSHEHRSKLNPILKIVHYAANQSILKAVEQASRLHIMDYGAASGLQWAYLINALADQKGGPPLLLITGIDYPQPGDNPAERLEESGWLLAAYAATYNVPFQYHAIVSSKWEDLDLSSFHFHEDEVLVVNCIKSLRYVAEEGVDLVSPRQKFLTSIRNLNPHLLITADWNASHNSSYFISRFREALYFYSILFDMADTLDLWGDSPERLLNEGILLYSVILNIVACEGTERIERAETYKQWQVRIKRAGFEQLLIPPGILSRSRSHLKQHHHEDFFVHDDANKWMLLGWKGRVLVTVSAWKPSHA